MKFILLVYLFFSSLLLSQETNVDLESKDNLEDKSEMYLLYTIEYGSLDLKEKALEVLAQRKTTSPNILQTANKYITYGYDDAFAESQYPNRSCNIRYWAAQIIKNCNDPLSVAYLISVLDSEDNYRVIVSAINTLGNIKSSASIDTLLKTISRYRNNIYIVNEVIDSLGKIGDSRALPILIEISSDRSYIKSIRVKALEASTKIEEPKYLPRATSSSDPRLSEEATTEDTTTTE